MARKSISKRTRFEIFKRDSFTCRYCGKRPPDTILHIDHILPVSKGGNNDLLNLITSCQECNMGKSNILISENVALEKQEKQIKADKENTNRINMIARARRALKNRENKELDFAKKDLSKLIGEKFSLSDSYIESLKKAIKKHSLKTVLEAIDICSTKYLHDKEDRECVDVFLEKIIKISSYIEDQKSNPWKKDAGYCYAILNNRFGAGRNGEYWGVLKKALTHKDFTFDEMKEVCSSFDSFYKIRLYVEGYLSEVK